MDVERLAEEIAGHGVKEVFGIPGSGLTLSLLDALEKRGVDFHLTAFEGTATLMAATIGRLSGKAGISLSIKGPGLANSVPGLATAWFEAFPVVHLTEAMSPDAPPHQAHKRLRHAGLLGGIAKGIGACGGSDAVLPPLFALAEAEEPGPVVLELVGQQKESASVAMVPDNGGMAFDDEAVLQCIKQAQRPVVVAGALAVRQGWGAALERLDIPVFTTAAAKGVLDENLPHAAGVYTGVGGVLTPEHCLLPQADLVVALGLTAREVLAVQPFSGRAVAVAAVPTPGWRGFGFANVAGLGAISAVWQELAAKSWGMDALAEARNLLAARLSEIFLPGWVFSAISRHFSGRVRAVLDTGYFCTIGEHAWPAVKAEWCLLSGQGRYMGAGLPMALGAALHDSEIPTVAFLGDGGIGMYLAEVGLAVRLRLPLLVVLMSDGGFGSIRTRAIKDGLSQAALRTVGRRWVECFEGLGIPGTRAEGPEKVLSALSAWRPADGPAFLEIAFDPEQYQAMMEGIR